MDITAMKTDNILNRSPSILNLALTKKLTHAPFRFSLTLHNLQQWNLDYLSLNQASSTLPTTSDTDTDNEKIGFTRYGFPTFHNRG